MSVTLKRNYNSFLESHQNEPCFSPKFNPTNIFNSSNSITPENFQQSQQEQREYFPSAKRMRPNNFSNNFEYKSNRVNYFPYGHQIVPYEQTFAHAPNLIKSKKRRAQKLYTEDEIKIICEDRENKIREEYDKILQNLLQEQFDNFAKFNQDYISRQLRERDYTYSYTS